MTKQELINKRLDDSGWVVDTIRNSLTLTELSAQFHADSLDEDDYLKDQLIEMIKEEIKQDPDILEQQ